MQFFEAGAPCSTFVHRVFQLGDSFVVAVLDVALAPRQCTEQQRKGNHSCPMCLQLNPCVREGVTLFFKVVSHQVKRNA